MNNPPPVDPDDMTEAEEGRFTSLLAIGAAVSLISSLLYGYDTGIIAGALLQITDDFHIDHRMTETIAAAILAGAIIGALACSKLGERIGRRKTVMMLGVIFVVGSLGCAFAPSAWELVGGRIVLGFAVGGATQTVPMYIAELAPSKHRGRLVLTFQIGIGTGILLATIIGASQAIPWRVAIGGAAIPAAVMLFLVTALPESPRWLVERAKRIDLAREVLQKLRGRDADVTAELDGILAIDAEQRKAESTEKSGWAGLRQPWVRPALIVGCGIAAFTQLSGIEMIVYYAPTILTDNGFSDQAALNVSVALGATYLIMMLIGLTIVDIVGRRRLTLIMVPGAAAALLVLGTLWVTGHNGREDMPFVIACFIVFMIFNAGGLQLMGWLTGSEIYPLAVRGAGTSAQAATLWGTNLIITLTFLSLSHAIGIGQTMWLYGLFNVIGWFFVYFKMPELTGHSLEEIEQHLRHGRFTPQHFQKKAKEKVAA